jgi:catechol 2,3-dioxygenase-like lactoylglutathione lyase family enzyme
MNWFRSRLLIALALSLVCGKAAPTQIETPELAGIAHVALRVSDLTRSRAFYEQLGFQQAFAFTKDGTTTEAFLKVNDRQFIEMYPQQEPSQSIGFMHVCFEGADLAGLNRDYLAHGLSPTTVKKAGAGNLLFTMEGPEKQNIEYTQYLPGSLHSNDQGKHLGANRISNRIVGVSLAMQDRAAAKAFYQQKLDFHPSRSLRASLALPGSSDQVVQIAPGGTAVQIFFSISDLDHTAAQLIALHLPVKKQRSTLTVQDPDGNQIAFVKWKLE